MERPNKSKASFYTSRLIVHGTIRGLSTFHNDSKKFPKMLIIIEKLEKNQFTKKRKEKKKSVPHSGIDPSALRFVGESVSTTLFRLLSDRR